MKSQRLSVCTAKKIILASACAIAALFLYAGCGGSGGSDGAATVGPDADLGQLTELEDLVYTEAFSGKLAVKFDETYGVRLRALSEVEGQAEGAVTKDELAPPSQKSVSADSVQAPAVYKLVSITGQDAAVAPMQQVLDAHPAALIERVTSAPEAEVDRQRARLERLSGQKMPDWNSSYTIDVGDPDEAVKIMRELSAVSGVKYVYPQFKPIPAGVLDTTPSLTGQQGYLYDEANSGGLNALAAWSAGTHGENVYLVDNESGMNFDHADFQPLQKIAWANGGNFLYAPDCAPGFPEELPDCDSWIAHGTAVGGILMAKDNGHGVTGFAPSANYLMASMASSVDGDLRISTDGHDEVNSDSDNDLEPGSVWVIEVGLPGKYTNLNCTPEWDAACEYGGVPVELWPDVYDAIQQATAYGVTVIEAGGNGQMNLNNPDLYTGSWTFAHNMATDDAGAIMVGASEGANENKISFSNCGTRVNSFAWGQGVVTTGYPYGPYAWNGTSSPKPPNTDPNAYFVDMFGGTSSAAAMVGGAAALVQSYARNILGHKRYLMPLKMREIIVGSGVTQKDTSGCNIGKQPRIDVALQQVDQFLATMHSQYPQLASDDQLTSSQMVALRQLGVGIVCKEFDGANSDPSCPDEEVFPAGTKIAKTYDFDGDSRADLVKFENGKWSVDLSSKGSGGDNYGAWDLQLSFTPISGKWVWPYVEDMNSDGRADFVAYDKEHGKFYVALTNTNLIGKGEWHGWDWVLDYSAQWTDDLKMNPDDSNYSRPAIGNYNGDGYNDIGIVCSDGNVRVDYGNGTEGSLGHYAWIAQLISNELLAQAPGWAYLPLPQDFNEVGKIFFGLKVPDGLTDEGRMYIIPQDGIKFHTELDWLSGVPHIFGNNDMVPLASVNGMINLKGANGLWQITTDGSYSSLEAPPPEDIYGGQDCHPLIADFDGDNVSDRAVMCPEEWRIAYSSTDKFLNLRDNTGVRKIALTYDKNLFSLPGRTYSGSISYTLTRQLIDKFEQMYPGQPPPILVDMVTTTSMP